MKSRIAVALVVLLAVLLGVKPGDGCGPDFPKVVTTRDSGPDRPFASFARGKLGVVLPTWYRGNLVIAYRYLSGGKLSAAERNSLKDDWSSEDGTETNDRKRVDSPYNSWLKARAKYMATPSPMAREATDEWAYGSKEHYYVYENCLGKAFENAIEVLKARAKKFGGQSAELQEWIRGQDAVFLYCGGIEVKHLPTPLPATANLLLRQDRAYQIAAARFYSTDLEGAARDFEQIGEDESSPWHVIAPYLVGRAMIRLADSRDEDFKHFDRASLQEAADQFAKILKDPKLRAIHEDARGMLNYAEFRLHPDRQQRVLARELVNGAGARYGQDLVDYTLLLNQFLDVDPDFDGVQRWDQGYDKKKAEWQKQRYVAMKKERGEELCDWLMTMQSLSTSAKDHAVARWSVTKSVPWLVAALWKVKGDDAAAAELLSAGSEVTPEAPAYPTVALQRIRLERERGKIEESRRLLGEAMARDLPLSAINLFLLEKAESAPTAEEFAANLARKPVHAGWDPYDADYPNTNCLSKDCENALSDPSKPWPKGLLPQFDSTTALMLNTRSPLELLVEAANSAAVPANLHRRLARSVWARAVLLDRLDMAAKVSASVKTAEPMMKKSVEEYEASSSPEERRFAGTMAILRFAGLRPFVDGLIPRTPRLDTIDNYRDNWWCDDVGADIELSNMEKEWETRRPGKIIEINVPYPTFLTAEQRTQADAEWAKLKAGGAAVELLPPIVFEWVGAHPDDPRVPEALHRTVRLTRYGCWGGKDHGYSRKAYTLLHSRYPSSEWTKKTPYWF